MANNLDNSSGTTWGLISGVVMVVDLDRRGIVLQRRQQQHRV